MPLRILVVGLGHIGLPTAAVFARAGLHVTGLDVDEAVVAAVNAGRPHFEEPNLSALVAEVVRAGRLCAATRPEAADVVIIAVPTPFRNGYEPNLDYIEAAAATIAPVLQAGNLVILESTVPVGATEQLADWLAEARPDLSFPQQRGDDSDIRVAHCPERVLPGRILEEVTNNVRVIGGLTTCCSRAAAEFYGLVVRGECRQTDVRTAEMAKLVENAFRDVNIAFANELSLICADLGIDVWELIRLANLHPRVNILNPGPGVGGHCIAVDPWFIVHRSPQTAKLIRAAREVNDAKPPWVAKRVLSAASGIADPVVACLGLAYKADVSDLRQSPSVDVVLALAEANVGRLLAVEPNVGSLPDFLAAASVELVTIERALELANVVVLLVDHREFKDCNDGRLRSKIVIDTRGIW